MDHLFFPKPSQIKFKPVAVRYLRDGKEQCNLNTAAGREEYNNRIHIMWERQGRMCRLHGHIVSCPGELALGDATFDHEIPRGHGGGSHDDRIEILDPETGKMKWQNGAVHSRCNYLKGSRRIAYNAAHNDAL